MPLQRETYIRIVPYMYVPTGTNVHISVRMYVYHNVYNVDVTIVMVILREYLYCNLSLVIVRTFCELGNVRCSVRTVLVRSRNTTPTPEKKKTLRLKKYL